MSRWTAKSSNVDLDKQVNENEKSDADGGELADTPWTYSHWRRYSHATRLQEVGIGHSQCQIRGLHISPRKAEHRHRVPAQHRDQKRMHSPECQIGRETILGPYSSADLP